MTAQMNVNLPKGFSKLNETIHPDGSGFTVSFNYYGIEYGANYVAGELRIRHTIRNPDSRSWKFKANMRAVEAFARERLAMMPAEWFAAHNALYAHTMAARAYVNGLAISDQPTCSRGGFPVYEEVKAWCAAHLAMPLDSDAVSDWAMVLFCKFKGV